jgi:hypothetical protein
LLFFALCVAPLLIVAAAPDEALLPPDGFNGWKRSGPPRVFTQADLYGYIDGGAELFLELGFDQLTLQKYKSGANEVGVEIYRMADPAAATGIYLAKSGRETPDAGLRERHTAGRHQLMMLRNRYFVIVNNIGGNRAVAPELVKFGGQVAAKAPPNQPVPALALLPPSGLDKSSVRLARGTYGLQAVYTLGEGDILQQGGKVVAAIGNYKDATGTYTMIAVEYLDAAAAKKAFAYVQAHLDEYLKPTSKTETRLVFQDYAKKYGVVALNGRRLEIKVKLGAPPRL